jgi:hypothetical protein
MTRHRRNPSYIPSDIRLDMASIRDRQAREQVQAAEEAAEQIKQEWLNTPDVPDSAKYDAGFVKVVLTNDYHIWVHQRMAATYRRIGQEVIEKEEKEMAHPVKASCNQCLEPVYYVVEHGQRVPYTDPTLPSRRHICPTSEDYQEGVQHGRQDYAEGYPMLEDDLESPVYQKYTSAREYAKGYEEGYCQAKHEAEMSKKITLQLSRDEVLFLLETLAETATLHEEVEREDVATEARRLIQELEVKAYGHSPVNKE